jgi:hypothetical protein
MAPKNLIGLDKQTLPIFNEPILQAYNPLFQKREHANFYENLVFSKFFFSIAG